MREPLRINGIRKKFEISLTIETIYISIFPGITRTLNTN